MAEQKTKAKENSRALAIEEVKGELAKRSPKCDAEDTQEGRHILLIVNAISAADELRRRISDKEEILRRAAVEGMRVSLIGMKDEYKGRYVDFDAKMAGAAKLLIEDTDFALEAAKEYVDMRVAQMEKEDITPSAKEQKVQSYNGALALIEEIAVGAKFFNTDKQTVRHA